MEQIRELTKRLIANSFKELLEQISFDKITIKMITDHANVIRPTFYNHFHDKYELVEWIVQEEIISEVTMLLFDKDTMANGVELLFTKFYEDRHFYRKAFEITGQNGFSETLNRLLTQMFKSVFSHNQTEIPNELAVKYEIAAKYCAGGLGEMVKQGIEKSNDVSLNELIGIYQFMIGHNLYEAMNFSEKNN